MRILLTPRVIITEEFPEKVVVKHKHPPTYEGQGKKKAEELRPFEYAISEGVWWAGDYAITLAWKRNHKRWVVTITSHSEVVLPTDYQPPEESPINLVEDET